MTQTPSTKDLFFTRTGLDPQKAENLVGQSLVDCEDGELFLEYCQSESLAFDDGRIKNASFDTTSGFGLRAVSGETTGYAHSSEISEDAIKRAAQTVAAVRSGHGGTANVEMAPPPRKTNTHLYGEDNPLGSADLEDKVALLAQMDAYAREKNSAVKQVSASLSGQWQAVHILRADGTMSSDIRPLTRLSVAVTVEKGDTMEQGSYGFGGRNGYEEMLDPSSWKSAVDKALSQALVNLDSVGAPAGEMTVVLGPGWPGILLHEAIGHGLEGDFNRKKTSSFSGLLGERIAAPGVTVIDDGTVEGRRGSLTIDDEGTPGSRTVLIEDGILKGYMFDRMNARLMGMKPTGNGRRQSFAHAPMPRMTNTCMLGGDHDPQEIIASVKNGLYAVNFGGGQVDITSGKFVFSASEAYMIENGKVGKPVKGATLIGNGPDVLTKVSMIGNDMAMDPGIGTCGKEGQHVPVGVGQPTLKIDGLTIGGTEG